MSDFASFDHGRDLVDQVEERLEDAARTLAALPIHGLRPSGARVAWPDILRDAEDVAHMISGDLVPRPTSADVTRMDLALAWLGLIDERDVRLRRVINMRLIVHPVSQMHRFSWGKAGAALGVSEVTAKRWHRRGCEVIAKKIATPAFSVLDRAVFAV